MSLSKINAYVVGYKEENAEVIIEILEEHLQKLLLQQEDIIHYIEVTTNKIKKLKSS